MTGLFILDYYIILWYTISIENEVDKNAEENVFRRICKKSTGSAW